MLIFWGFLKIFVENYDTMMKDFVADDHDHSFSITVLSVQLFTVASIVHYLIESQDVISKLMGTFKAEWQQYLDAGMNRAVGVILVVLVALLLCFNVF